MSRGGFEVISVHFGISVSVTHCQCLFAWAMVIIQTGMLLAWEREEVGEALQNRFSIKTDVS